MKKDNKIIWIFAVVILLAIVSLYFDAEIVKSASLIRNELLTDFFMAITFASSNIAVLFILTVLFLSARDKRRWLLPLWFTLLASGIVNYILKIIIQRPRPFNQAIVATLPALAKNSYLTWNSSMPSGHAMLVFAAIPLLSMKFPKLKYAWIVFAVLIAFSRVYFGLHFLSDVIFGALIGYLIGFTILKTEKENKFIMKTYNKFFRISGKIVDKILKK